MPNVPTWIQYLQALSTPAIALLAVTIGVLQWRTAHQRAVLDLFDRRMENYDALNAAIFEILREGKATTTNLVAFDRAVSRARFLFGKDVAEYLGKTRQTIVGLYAAEVAARTDDDTKRVKAADLEADHLMNIVKFYEQFSTLVQPYVMMHQKALPF
jgi:hypothetical protein